MNELIWTKAGRHCPKNQFEVGKKGFKALTAGDLFISNTEIKKVSLGVCLRVMHPLLLMFTQADYFGKLIVCNQNRVIMPEILEEEIYIDILGISNDEFLIPEKTHLVNMVVLNIDYCNLFEVSSKQFNYK